MDCDNKKYLLVITYFSKYPFLFQMSFTTMTAFINYLKGLFALKGMPSDILIDNRHPFNSIQTMNSILNKVKVSRVSVPQTLMKL